MPQQRISSPDAVPFPAKTSSNESLVDEALIKADRLSAHGEFLAASTVLETVLECVDNELAPPHRFRLLVKRAQHLRNAECWSEARSCQLIAQRIHDSGEAESSNQHGGRASESCFDLFYGHACDAIHAEETEVATALLGQLQQLAESNPMRRTAAIDVAWARLFSMAGKHALAVFRLADVVRQQVRLGHGAELRESLELLRTELSQMDRADLADHVTQLMDSVPAMLTDRPPVTNATVLASIQLSDLDDSRITNCEWN